MCIRDRVCLGTSGVEHHPRWHRHNRAGPRRVVMVEDIVDPAPDLSAGGEEGEVGYAPMQHATQSHTNDIPSSPTHTTSPPPHIISCCPLEPVHCIMSHKYPACIPGPGVENAGAMKQIRNAELVDSGCLLYTSPSPRDS